MAPKETMAERMFRMERDAARRERDAARAELERIKNLMAVPQEVVERAAKILHPDPAPKRPVFADRAPSEEFVASFPGGGSSVIQCEFCGRISVGSSDCFDPGERERYEASATTDPDGYVFRDYDSIGNFELDGKVFVVDCPCNAATRYERLVWTHRDEILGYLRAAAERKTKEAQRLTEAVAAVPSSLRP